MASLRGSLVTEQFTFDGGRSATACVPIGTPDPVVFAADGSWHTELDTVGTGRGVGGRTHGGVGGLLGWRAGARDRTTAPGDLAGALTATGADVAFEKREGEHGGQFWYDEFPSMVSWAFSDQ